MKDLSLVFLALLFSTVSAMAAEPDSRGFYIGGMAGYAELDDDGLFDDAGYGLDNETVGSAGLGVRYYATPNLGISLQIDAYAYEEDDYYSNYDLSVATTQVGVHYLF